MGGAFEDRVLALYATGHRDFRGEMESHEPDFSGATLHEADLSGLDLKRASFRGADLQRVTLRGASLWEAHLNAANLLRADLRGVDASSADFGGANLREADLSGALLISARFGGADLRGADLRGANLAEPTRRRSQKWLCDNCLQLREVYQNEGGRRASFEGARYDRATQWPTAFDPQEEGALLADVDTDAA